MAKESVEKLVERGKKAWDEKNLWQPTLQDAYTYALPGRNLYLDTSPGQLKSEQTYDSTLMSAVHRSANLYQTELFPPGEDWASIVTGRLWKALGRDESEVVKVQRMLDDLTKICFGLLHSSNFDTSVGEFLLDWLISTGVILSNPGMGPDAGIEFCSVPLYQVAIECNAYGKTTAVFRNFKVKARDVEPTWKRMKFKAPDAFNKFAEDKPNEPVDIMEVTYYEYDSQKWCYMVILKGNFGSGSEYHPCAEAEYRVNPWIVTPYTKVAGESLGRGPVLLALPDARVLNKTKELTLQAASLAIFPPLMVLDDGVINMSTVKLKPGAPIPVGRNDGAIGPSIKPLTTGDNFDVSDLVISDGQNTIRHIMNDDSIPEQGGAVRSATEYMARMRDSQRYASPRARLMVDFYRPLFQILVERANELGLLNRLMEKHSIDASTIKIDGMFADISVTSPLFQSRNMDRLDAISAGMNLILGLGPEIAGVRIKIEDLPAEIWECLALPSKYVRTDEEAEAMQINIAQILAAQQQPAPAA
jgi:hypothetical protein